MLTLTSATHLLFPHETAPTNRLVVSMYTRLVVSMYTRLVVSMYTRLVVSMYTRLVVSMYTRQNILRVYILSIGCSPVFCTNIIKPNQDFAT